MFDDLIWAKALLDVLLTTWPIWAILAAFGLLRLAVFVVQQRRLARSGILDIDRMDGETFEKRLEILFRQLGYKVERTQYRGDYGADLVVSKDGVKTVVQAKRYQKNVGLAAIQQVVAAKAKYGCTAAIVVTNSAYTKPAQELAAANKVELWDRSRLMKALLSVQQPTDRTAPAGEAAAPTEPAASSAEVCATCGKPVSAKERAYCLSQPGRFGGRVYCYQHQKRVPASA